ncbi:MAG: hypothetical protein PVH12_04210 [Candidatus Bathyarchaeota archaeon]
MESKPVTPLSSHPRKQGTTPYTRIYTMDIGEYVTDRDNLCTGRLAITARARETTENLD